MTAKNLFQLQGQNTHTATYGEQGDISNICQFGWYKWVYARYGSEPSLLVVICLLLLIVEDMVCLVLALLVDMNEI